ncbi:RanBP1 domain-containing protein [Mrakia frigida]|uniref:Ran-binding domain-containing protein n=1 Tax=Mrakia frigida TaxID=29902 RepID=UPI003FCC2313
MAEEEQSGAPEVDPQFEPVHKLTEQVVVSTGEEGDIVLFKMRAKLFRFDKPASEWKERGTGEVKILSPQAGGKIRLVMRRDKTLKVCANHIVSSDMNLAPNIGSDRSWVWNVSADVSDGEPTQETLAIRFANSDNAGLFKAAFEDARDKNSSTTTAAPAAAEESEPTPAAAAEEEEEKKEEEAVVEAKEEPVAAAAAADEPKAEEEETAVAPAAAVEELKTEEKVADEGVETKATEDSLVPEAAAEEKKAE